MQSNEMPRNKKNHDKLIAGQRNALAEQIADMEKKLAPLKGWNSGGIVVVGGFGTGGMNSTNGANGGNG